MMILALAALVAASLFTGAAAYISLAEHPARMTLDASAALAQWKPSYAKALPIQSGLAIIGGLAGMGAWYVTGNLLWIAGSVALLANWPFTLIGIMPTNQRLKAIPIEAAGEDSDALLRRWGKLHAVRSMLGALSALLFAFAIAVPHQ
jgi:hypothetical protein